MGGADELRSIIDRQKTPQQKRADTAFGSGAVSRSRGGGGGSSGSSSISQEEQQRQAAQQALEQARIQAEAKRVAEAQAKQIAKDQQARQDKIQSGTIGGQLNEAQNNFNKTGKNNN